MSRISLRREKTAALLLHIGDLIIEWTEADEWVELEALAPTRLKTCSIDLAIAVRNLSFLLSARGMADDDDLLADHCREFGEISEEFGREVCAAVIEATGQRRIRAVGAGPVGRSAP